MKNLIVLLMLVLFGAGTANAQCYTDMACCSHEVTVVLDQTEFPSLHLAPNVMVSPPAGYGVALTRPPVMKVYNDGSTLIFASGEFINVTNDETNVSGNYLSQFPDPFLYFNGSYTGSFWHSYKALYNGQLTNTFPQFTSSGNVYLESTFPISGGGPNAKIVVTLWYDLVKYL